MKGDYRKYKQNINNQNLGKNVQSAFIREKIFLTLN